jgi:extracellular factor (EF) 3-hydroxypalmitic acid methyl ester biosynthesis protein
MNIQLSSSRAEITTFLNAVIENDGPVKADYEPLNLVLNNLRGLLAKGVINQQEIDGLTQLPFLQSVDSIMGHIRIKPYGYAGDFKIIERIYTFDTAKEFQLWDDYSINHVAAQAVRNRKDYFKALMLKKISNDKIELLDLASGPARDLKELYDELEQPQLLHTDCVDLEAQAIEYAGELCQPYSEQIRFFTKNILKFRADKTYDCIWSAGLFDYLNDDLFVFAIKRFKKYLKPGGEIVIGNFSNENPSRDYMEIFGDWFLIHRSPEELTELGIKAGFEAKNITVDREPLGINLFLHLKE